LDNKEQLKVFFWYLYTEPWRKLKKVLTRIEKGMNISTLLYFYLVFSAILFIKNRHHPMLYASCFIIIIVLFRNIWVSKHFIYRYRLEQKKEERKLE